MTDLSVNEAAEQLGVHPTRVRGLLASGGLAGRRVGSFWLVDGESVARRLETADSAKGRPLSTRIAWSAAALLEGQNTPWLTTSERSRLRTRLRQHDSAETYRRWLQARARTARYRISDNHVDELFATHGVVAGGISAARHYGLDIESEEEVEIYVDTKTAEQLIDDFILVESARGNLLLHVEDSYAAWHLWTARTHGGVSVVPRLVVAADLLDSDDSGSQDAGARLLEHALRPVSSPA